MEHLCKNCGLSIRKIQKFSLEGEDLQAIRALISENIGLPVNTTDRVCASCWRQLHEHIVKREDPLADVKPMLPSHRRVCLNCGISVLRRKSRVLSKHNETNSAVYDVIAKWIVPREIKPCNEICAICWLKAFRAWKKTERLVSSPQQSTDSESSSESSVFRTRSNSYMRSDDSPYSPEHKPVIEKEPTIELSSYGRVAVTCSSCVFKGCNNTERRRIHMSIRKMVLYDYNIYIAPKCRVCATHSQCTDWEPLNRPENIIHTFTAAQINDLLDLMKAPVCQLDFENIELIEESLFSYFLGISKQEFFELISEVPAFSDRRRGNTELAIYLMKLRTGDTNVKISKLLKIPRVTLERLLKDAKKLLLEHFSSEADETRDEFDYFKWIQNHRAAKLLTNETI